MSLICKLPEDMKTAAGLLSAALVFTFASAAPANAQSITLRCSYLGKTHSPEELEITSTRVFRAGRAEDARNISISDRSISWEVVVDDAQHPLHIRATYQIDRTTGLMTAKVIPLTHPEAAVGQDDLKCEKVDPAPRKF